MPITSAADRIIASLETKRLRRPWNPDLHPRDSKGRFIETGGIARLWGGGMARVLRSLGGRNVLVENVATRKRSTIHASRLTMVARPDGSAPTKSKRKVRDEDERRYGDQNRGLGYGEHAPDTDDDPDTDEHPGTDRGDNGQTPDDPHDQDDEGNPIGDDVDGVDLGADPDDPEDDDDEPMVPQGRVMSRPSEDDEDPGRSASDRGNHPLRDFPTLLPIVQDAGGAGPESRRRRHVMGNGDALRADGPEVNKHWLQFWDTNHARRALRDLSNDYFEDLENAWPGEWGNSEADDVYNELADYLGGGEPFDLADSPTDQADPTEFDRLSWFADDAERLAELAEQDGKEDVARYAQNLADALNLAHRRFQAHGKKPIPKPSKKRRKDQPLVPRAWRSDGTASTAYRVKPAQAPSQPAAATPKARNKGGKRFANLDALQQHWQSGNLEPATSDKAAQQRHQQETAGLFAKLDKPQLSRRGTFVVAKMTVEKGGKPKTGYAVIVSGSGARLAMSERKGEAMEFANRLEVAQIDGTPFDWDSPGYHQRLESPEGQKMVRQAGEDAKKAFTDKAAKKKQGAAEKRTPAAPTQPEQRPRVGRSQRFASLDDVRAHWASGNLTPYSRSERQHAGHVEALKTRMGELGQPQLSRGGYFTIGKLPAKKPSEGPMGWAVIHNDTGIRLGLSPRKDQALDLSSRLENAEGADGPINWDDPTALEEFRSPEGRERLSELTQEAQHRATQRAQQRRDAEAAKREALAAKREAALARHAARAATDNSAVPVERPNPLVQAAQQLGNIGVGHIGPASNNDNSDGFKKPSTTGQLRDYWKNGGDPALDDRSRDRLRAYAGREGWKITMSDHRGFAVIQMGPNDFEVVRAYDGRKLGHTGGAGGKFKTLDDADRFAMRLGAELEEPGRPGQPIDWWDPELYKRHPSRIGGWKRDFGVLMDDIRGQHEIDAGREDTYWAQEYRKRQAERDTQQQSGNVPEQGAAPAPATPQEQPQQQTPQAQPERPDYSQMPREALDGAYEEAARAFGRAITADDVTRASNDADAILAEAQRRDTDTYQAQLARITLGERDSRGHVPVSVDGVNEDDATLQGSKGMWKWNRIGHRTRYSSERTFLTREAALADLVRERDEEKGEAARAEADRAARAEERDLAKMAAETALQQQINEALQEAQNTLLPVINDLQRLHGEEAARELAYGSAEAAERFERGESTPSEAIQEFQAALDAIQRATRGLEGRDNMYVQKLMRLARDNVSAARKALADHNERNSGVRGSRPDVLENVPAQRGGGDGQQRGAGGVRPAAVGGDSRGNRGADGRVGAAPSGGDGRGGAGARAEVGADAGSRAGAARDGLRRGEGAGDGDEGHAAGGAAASVGDDDTGPAAPTPSSTAAKWLQRVRNGAIPAFEPPADGATLAPSSPLNRAKANIAAIEILHRLQDEDRPPTADEQAELARYSGWGAVPQIFKPRPDAQFAPLAERLRELLTDAEWEDARSNTLNAHYTDPQIVQQVWAAVRDLGFENGEVLEPGSGIGNFIGYAPDGAQMTGVEVDPITARIAGALYPHSEIRHESFGETRAPNGTFDMAIGNVPFGRYKVPDLVHNKGGHSIHNHFILKSLDLTRGGGLVAVVTSALTMDGHGGKAEAARMEMAEKADLVGAIRLPSGAHQRTAGTSVMTDLLIFRRRDKDKSFNSGRNRKGEIKRPSERGKDDPPMWVHSLPRFGLPGQADPEKTEGAQPVFYNSYFHDHPEQVLGKLAVGHGLHRDNELRVDGDGDTIANLARTLKRTVAAAKDAGLGYQAAPADRKKVTLLPPGSDRVDGHVQAEPDGTFTQVRDGMVHPFPVPKTQADEGRRLLAIRDTFQSLLAEESRKDADDSLIERLRAELNEQYQAYFDKYGAINRYTWAERNTTDPETGETVKKKYRKKAQRAGLFTKDPTMANISPLDEYDDITKKTTRAAIFTKRQGTYREIAEYADSPQDALAIVMEREGQLTADGLARVMDTDAEDAVAQLLAARSVDPDTGVEYPLAFQAPDGKLVMAADYLSGNVREKLTAAREAAAENPAFDINVEHLERVIPPDLSTGEIAAPMGASWLGQEPVQQFLRETLGTDQIKVSWQGGSLWAVDAPDAVKKAVAFRTRDTWSAPGYDAIKLAEAILTNRKIVVTVKTRDGSIFDPKATEDAKTKAELLKEAFTDWLWADPDRAEKYKRLYNDQFNSMAPRSYDGQRRTIPGLVEWFKPHPHQHAAVARMVNEPSVLLAHEVGAGKTAEMAMGVMELRRLGLVKKAALVVPGHMLDQFRQEFAEIFPESVANNRILTASSDDLAGKGRREFIARAAAGDYDAIIMTQTAFESIQMRPEVQETYIKRRLERLEAKIEAQKAIDGEDNDTRLVKRMETQLKTLREKLDKKLSGMKDAAGLHFEDMGIDYVVVDEAHMYKNLDTPSAIAAIDGSNRASDLEMKLEWLRERSTTGRVVTFATATPVANSIAEVHTMMRYLRPDLLEQLGLMDFDDFASTFGQMVSAVERGADGSYTEKVRLAAFQNVPELLRLWRAFADVKTSEDLDLPVPDIAGGKAVTITMPMSEAQELYEEEIKARAARLAGGNVDPKEDNHLKLLGDGRMAALDPRLIDPEMGGGNKLPTVADNIVRIHEQTKDAAYPTSKTDPTPHPEKGGLQIVFLDLGTPKDPGKTKKRKKKAGDGEDAADPTGEDGEGYTDFSTYDELKQLLIARGIPSEKIRFIHEAKDDAAKARLFHEARTGKVSVLLGSTAKMGTGTNVQLRATALHHVDAPWRPADVEQRNGRVIRQGNANAEVAIFQYATERSTDAKFWEAIARKARFIRQLMRGSLNERVVEDIGEVKFDADEASALVAGDPHLIAQAQLRPIVKRLRARYNAHQRSQEGFQRAIRDAELAEEQTTKLVATLQDAIAKRKPTRGENFNARIGRTDFAGTEGREEARKALSAALRAVEADGRRRAYDPDEPPKIIGQVGGLDIAAKFSRAWNSYASRYDNGVRLELPAIPGSSRTYESHDLVDVDGKPPRIPLQRVEDSIANLEAQVRRQEDMLIDKRRAAEQASARVGKPFELAEEFDKANRQLEILNEVMRLKAQPQSTEAAAAQQKASIDALDAEMRALVGEEEEDVLAQVSARDLDLTPKTPAPPSITQDNKGQVRFIWPTTEARDAERDKKLAAKRAEFEARFQQRQTNAPSQPDALTMNESELTSEVERLGGLIAREEASEADILRHAGLQREQKRRTRRKARNQGQNPAGDAGAASTPEPTAEDTSTDAPETATDSDTRPSEPLQTEAPEAPEEPETDESPAPQESEDDESEASEAPETQTDESAAPEQPAQAPEREAPSTGESADNSQAAQPQPEESPAAAKPSPARERAPRNRERQQPAVRPFANDREWRQALAEVEAAQGEITRAVEAAYGRGEEPGSARALRTAVFDAIAAQEAGDFDDATGGLAEAHEHAQRLRDELPSDVDAEPLARFMRVVDDYLARHAVTVEKRRREDEQRDRAEQQADAALRESLGLSPAPAPAPAPEADASQASQPSEPDTRPAPAPSAGRAWEGGDFQPGDTVHFWNRSAFNAKQRGEFVRSAGPDSAILRGRNGDEREVEYIDIVGRTRDGEFQDDPPATPAGNEERPAAAPNPQPAPAAPSPAPERAERPRSAPSDSRPVAGTSPADMTDEEIADEVDDLHDRIEALREATNSVDLAYRLRLEKRKFDLEDAERRRWKPTPEYDDDGKVKERDRGDVIRDRLSGYGLNDAEAVGLVERVEDLPAAKEGGYSDEEWARISAEAAARESYPPTEEQNIIIEGAARRGLNMAVMALAGTGKSSTLKMLSHRMPGKKIVYLAFNRSVAAEAREAQARGEYAKNLTASTANAYAAKVADKRLNNRLPSNRRNGFKKLSAQQIADRMRWYDTVKAGNRDLSPGGAATVAERMIREWAKSADAEMLPKHITGAKSAQERRDLFNAVKPLADRMWDNLTDPTRGDPDEDLTMDFDYIVKMWALGGYKLDADTLFWDEAQDVNPVMEGVVRGALAQGVQVVAVGDSNQAIYGFRGAADALGKLPVDARATLTQSFRFGPAVADAGNRFLRLLGTRMRLKGFDRKQSRLDTINPGDETMVIARTNAGVALAAVEALSAGRRVAVSGGVKDLQEFVQAARALANGERTDHAELARFNGMAFDDILEAVKGDPDLQQLKSLFDLLEKHADDIDKLLESGAQRAETENVGGRVWVNLDWNDPKVDQLKRWLGDGKNNGVGKLLYDPATRRYFYEPGKRDVPWKNERSGRSGVHKVDNKLSLEEAQQKIDAHLAKLYPQEDTEGGRLVDEKREHDVLVTTAHKSKGLESERVRIADDFRGPEYNEHGNIKWETIPDDEALRVAYVALTRATDVLDAGSLGWVFQATREDDPTLPPNGDYRRDWVLDEFNVGDRIDFQEEDGTPNVGTVDRIDAPGMYVRYEVDGQDREQWIGPAQVLRLNGQGRPQLPVASDEELDRALAEGRYEPVSTTPAPSAGPAAAPVASPSADAPEVAAGRQWNVDDWVVTPNGEGRVIVSDGDKVIVLDGGGAPRTYEPRQLSKPGEARTAEHDAPTAEEAAREDKRQQDLEAAQSPEGLQLFYGARLANLDLDEGHGQVLDGDGNVAGWVRRRGSVWLGQDARGGSAQGSTAESASDPLRGPRGAAQTIDSGRGDSHMRLPLQDTSWRHLRPEEGRDQLIYSEFSDAQREQFFKLIKDWQKSPDPELSQAAQTWSDGLNYQQMERIAAAFTAAADDVDASTPEGRREQAVLNRAADKVRAQARRAWLNWQTMPPPGEPDVVGNYDNADWAPYGHRGDAARPAAPAPAAGDGADAPAASSRYGGDMVPASEIRKGDWVSVDQDDIFGRGPGRIVGKVTAVRVNGDRVTFDVAAKKPGTETTMFGEHAVVELGDLVERLPEGNPGREDTSDLARRLEELKEEQRARRKRVPEGWTAVEDPMSLQLRPGDRLRVRDGKEHGTGRQMYKDVVVRSSEPERFDSDGIALWADELNPAWLFRQHNIVAVPEDREARSDEQNGERDRRDDRREGNDDQRAPKREREGREGGSGGGGEPPNGGDVPQRGGGDDEGGQDSGRQEEGGREDREDDDRRRRRNRSGNDRPRPEGAGGGPDLPRPRVPHMPDTDGDAPDSGPDGGAPRGDGNSRDSGAGKTLDRAAAARRFGSAERMRDLAGQAVAIDDLGPAGSYGEVWMDGRLIGHAIHTTGNSWAPYSKFTRDAHPDFQEREGAVAELVRLAQEHGELPVDRLTESTPLIGSVVRMPSEAPGRLDFTPEESERWRALSGLLDDLRAGRPASGNVADDISRAIDELDWVTGRYKPSRDEFWKPGADLHNLRSLLDTIQPENQRALHHRVSQQRAAWKALQALEESGLAGTATPIRDLRPGDVVRVMGKRPAWDLNDTEYSGYLRGAPKRVTRTRDGQKERVWQLRLGSTPWDDDPDATRVTPRHEMTVQVPADGTGNLLARADDVDMPSEDYVERSRATVKGPDGAGSNTGGTDGPDAGSAAPEGDSPRVLSTEEMRAQYATGEKEVISPEGERALFGSPERMRELAEEGTAPTPALQADQGEQVWRNGRYIGRLFAPHRFVNADDPQEVWWSQEPWDSRGINFSTREAAIANLVLRDKERGEPDLSVVPERLARGIALYDDGLAFDPDDEFRGYPSLEDDADDMRRYRGLRAHLAQLGRGESPSGNVADDLAHAHDELLWLDSTHYKEPESEQGKGHMVGPGSLARMLGDALNSLRPEDPRATHHQQRQDRAAKQFLDQLKADGGESRAVSVPVGELQPGDIVRLSGRITGLYPGATGDQIGYVVGKPARATITQNGKRTQARRIALSPSPRSQYGVGGSTFLIPADENVRRLMAAGDVRLPLDEHTYGRQLGETSRLDHPNGLDRAPGSNSAPDAGSPEPGQRDARAGGSAASQAGEKVPSGQAPARSEGSPVTGGAAAPSQGGAASRSGDAPARGTDASPTSAGSRSTGSGPRSGERTGAGTGGAPASRPQQSEAPAADTGTDEPTAAPEPVGGRPAEWVRVSDIGVGDLVRIDGTTKRGTARTLAGYVVDGPREIQTTQGRKMQGKHRVLISDTPDGAGSPVWVSPDAAAARATRDGDDTTVAEGSPRTGADSDVLTGRISGRVATDGSGNGLFPGSLVTDARGNDGVVVGANAATVQVRFGDDRTDDVQAPSSLNVTDGGAARPAGWTPDGHRVDVGHVVGDRDGNMLGTVEEVDGDTATVATPDGMIPMPVTGLRVLGGTADSSDQQPKVARVERVTAGDLREGDVMVRDGHPTKITGIERDEETTLIGSDDPDTGETDWQAIPNGTPVDRALDVAGGAPDLAPEDTPKPAEPITSHEPKPHVEPVTGPTVDPQLSPEERDAATDRSASATSDPDAEQAAARIGQDLPVTPQQASALADDLREGADPATPEGRAAKRAADHLDRAARPSGEAAGTTPDTTSEDVVIGGKRRAPNPLNPQINYIDGISREAWEQAKATYARSQTTNLGTPDWMFESMLKGIYGLKPDAIRDVLAHLKNGTEPAEFSRRPGTPDAGVPEGRPEPGTVGSVGEGDTIALPIEDNPDEMAAYRVVHIQEAAGGMRVLTVEDGDGIRSKRTLASGDALYQLPEPDVEPQAPTPTPAAGTDGSRNPNPAPDWDTVQNDYADAVARAVVDSAIEGTTTPGSIHALRQQIAEKVTTEALRDALQNLRRDLTAEVDLAGVTGDDRTRLLAGMRRAAAKARTAAVRAAVRTLDDLEPLDGEFPEDTAKRAAELLRLIPESLRNRTEPSLNEGDGPAAGRVADEVSSHVSDAVTGALHDLDDGPLTPERRAQIVARLAGQMAASRDAAARRIAGHLPDAQMPGILAALVQIGRRVVELVAAFLKGLAAAVIGAARAVGRFVKGLARRVRSWPETRRLRRLQRSLPRPADGLSLAERMAHWGRLLPVPGRFGQVSRRARWYRRASRTALAAGQMPAVQDGMRWTADRAADRGPGAQALRHLAAVRAAGSDVDGEVIARLAAAAPELGDDPHGTVRHARRYAARADARLRDLQAAAAGGTPDLGPEIDAARLEVQHARQEAARLHDAYRAALPEAVRGALAEVREMGPAGRDRLTLSTGSDAEASRALVDASRYVPRDWLADRSAGFLTAVSGDAGGYDVDSGTATVADLGDGGRSTAAHALLAHLQQHYPDLQAAQEAFGFVRTHTGRPGARRSSVDVLLERLFGGDQVVEEEIVARGLAAMFSGDWYRDDDLRAFLMGLLATR